MKAKRVTLSHPASGTFGEVEDRPEHPDGRKLVRILDQWFFEDECEERAGLVR